MHNPDHKHPTRPGDERWVWSHNRTKWGSIWKCNTKQLNFNNTIKKTYYDQEPLTKTLQVASVGLLASHDMTKTLLLGYDIMSPPFNPLTSEEPC